MRKMRGGGTKKLRTIECKTAFCSQIHVGRQHGPYPATHTQLPFICSQLSERAVYLRSFFIRLYGCARVCARVFRCFHCALLLSFKFIRFTINIRAIYRRSFSPVCVVRAVNSNQQTGHGRPKKFGSTRKKTPRYERNVM